MKSSLLDYNNGDVEEDGEPASHDILSTMRSGNGKLKGEQSAKMTVSQDGKVAKERGGEESDLDHLIKGVNSCTIQPDQGKELCQAVRELTIHDQEPKTNGCAVEPNQVPPPKRSQPREDDERGDVVDKEPEKTEAESKKKHEAQKKAETLVKLQAPRCFSASEEEEEEEQQTSKGLTPDLTERGPMGGVAAANYHPHLQYMGQKSCLPSSDNGILNFQMPANFPNYSHSNGYYQTSLSGNGGGGGSGGKRGMDVQEIHFEPPKFTRPEDVDLAMGMMSPTGYPNNLNNLDSPGLSPPASGKKVSNVYQKQMSGGTVFSVDDNLEPSGDQIPTGPWAPMGVQLSSVPSARSDPLDIVENWNIMADEELNVSHLDELLGLTDEPEANTFHYDQPNHQMASSQFPNQMSGPAVSAHSQGPLPPVSSLRKPIESNTYPSTSIHQHQPVAYIQTQSLQSLPQGSFHISQHQEPQMSPRAPQMKQPQQYLSHQMPQQTQLQQNMVPHYQQQQQQQQQQMLHQHQQREMVPSPEYNFSLMDQAPKSVEDMGYFSPSHDSQTAFSPDPCPYPAPSPANSHQSGTSPPRTNFSPPLSVMSQDSGHSSPITEHGQPSQDLPEHSKYIDNHLEELNDALATASKDLMDQAVKARVAALNQTIGPHGTRPAYSGVVTNPAEPQPVQNSSRLAGVSAAGGVQAVNAPQMVPVVSPPLVGNQPVKGPQMVPAHGQRVVAVPGPPQKPQVQGVAVGTPINLPTTVAAVLNSSPIVPVKTKDVANPKTGQQGKGQQGGLQRAGPPQSQAAPPPPPQINKEGKIAIPKVKPNNCVLPVMVSVTSVPLIIVPPVNTLTRPPPRYTPIAPRESSKPENSTGSQACQSKGSATAKGTPNTWQPNIAPRDNRPNNPPTGGQPPANERNTTGPRENQLLILAHRLVADMKDNELTAVDNEGDTCLHVAVCQADKFLVKAMLDRLRRRNLMEMQNKQNAMGQTPLYLAVSTNHPEMVQLLVEYGADITPLARCTLPSGDLEQTAAIHCAASKGEGYLKTLVALLKVKDTQHLNLVNSDGHTALQCAILCHGKNSTSGPINSIPIVQALLQHGADPNVQVQKNGKTALMFALESHDLDLIESTFKAVDQTKLTMYLKTQAFDSNTCLKIAENLKHKLAPVSQQRLVACLKGLPHHRNTYQHHPSPPAPGGSSSPQASPMSTSSSFSPMSASFSPMQASQSPPH